MEKQEEIQNKIFGEVLSNFKLRQWWNQKKPTVMFLLGMVVASVIAWNIYCWRMDETVKQGSIIYNQAVYDVILRVTQ